MAIKTCLLLTDLVIKPAARGNPRVHPPTLAYDIVVLTSAPRGIETYGVDTGNISPKLMALLMYISYSVLHLSSSRVPLINKHAWGILYLRVVELSYGGA